MKQTTVDAYNDGRSREEILDLGSDANKDNLYITIVFEFAKATKERKPQTGRVVDPISVKMNKTSGISILWQYGGQTDVHLILNSDIR